MRFSRSTHMLIFFVFGDFNAHHKGWLTYSVGTNRPGGLCYGSFHVRPSNGWQVRNFKFLQISTIDTTNWEEIIQKIWRSKLFSIESYSIFSDFFLVFWSKIKILRKFDSQFWLMYSTLCSQFRRMLIRLSWLYGKVN